MKAKQILIIIIIISSLLSSCCKCKDQSQTDDNKLVQGPEYITGEVKIIDGKVAFDLEMKVATQEFEPLKFRIFNYHGFKGVAILYANKLHPENEDDDVKETMTYKFDTTNSFKNEENETDTIKWKEGDKIRIMPVNENELDFTEKGDLYFKNRMAYFETDNADASSLLDFNKNWNYNNPLLKVRTYDPNKKPRIIKGDIVLGIKL